MCYDINVSASLLVIFQIQLLFVINKIKIFSLPAVLRPNVYIGLSASCYFPGDCTDSNVQETIRHNFINVVKNSLFEMEVCPDSSECNAANVQVHDKIMLPCNVMLSVTLRFKIGHFFIYIHCYIELKLNYIFIYEVKSSLHNCHRIIADGIVSF